MPVVRQRHRAGEGERRHLTVVFCDLVGSTEIAARLDPEEWRELAAEYHHNAAVAVERYDGYVAKYLGDGVLAYFGWPEAHDDDAERAARAGLAILDGISKLNQQPNHTKLAVRVGIDSGTVVIGAGARKETDVFGETPNIAARVQAAAEPDSILITDATHRLISGLFIVEDRGAQSLKGITRLVRLYRILRSSGVRGRFKAAAARGLTPFVGRDEEMHLLMNRWQRVHEGEGQVLTIIGEAGIGKSRLVQHFRDQIVGEEHTWLECATAEIFRSTPFYAVADMLQQTFHLHADQNNQRRLSALEASLTMAGIDPDEGVPLIAPIMDLPLQDKYSPLTIAPDQQRRRLLSTLVRWTIGFAKAQPLVFLIEDLHWADPSTLEFIQSLAEHARTARLLLLLTARPEFHSEWPLLEHHTQITLNRLSAVDVRAMIEQVAAQAVFSPDTLAMVVERTTGVPLFVEELTRAVLESGQESVAQRAIPATLEDSLMARLDRLGPAKEVLQIGAVIGAEFSYELLQAIHPMAEHELGRALQEFCAAELLFVRGIAPDASYQFKHALIRDAAYEALLKSRRKQLHAHIGRILEKKFPELAKSHPEVVARHYTEGDLIGSALPYWQRAGQLAVERSANLEAIDHLGKGIELSRKLPDTAERAQQELALQILLGGVLVATRGFAAPEVKSTYARARELCEHSGEAPQLFPVLFGLWVYYYVRGEVQIARELAEKQCLRLGLNVQDPAFLLEAHLALGATLFHIGELESARDHVEQSLSLYDARVHRSHAFVYGQDPGTVSGIYLSFILWHLGFPDQALKILDNALDLARELKHPFTSAFALLGAAWVHQSRRDVETVQAHAEEALAISSEHGFPLWSGMATVLRGWALSEQGHGQEGIEQIRQGWHAFQATGGGLQRPFFLSMLAEACLKARRIEDGRAALTEALTSLNKNGEHNYEAEIYRIKGQYLVSEPVPNEGEAERYFRSAIELARMRSAKSLQLRATTGLVRLLVSQKRRDEARAMLAEIYSWFTEGFDTADLKEAQMLFNQLAA